MYCIKPGLEQAALSRGSTVEMVHPTQALRPHLYAQFEGDGSLCEFRKVTVWRVERAQSGLWLTPVLFHNKAMLHLVPPHPSFSHVLLEAKKINLCGGNFVDSRS